MGGFKKIGCDVRNEDKAMEFVPSMEFLEEIKNTISDALDLLVIDEKKDIVYRAKDVATAKVAQLDLDIANRELKIIK